VEIASFEGFHEAKNEAGDARIRVGWDPGYDGGHVRRPGRSKFTWRQRMLIPKELKRYLPRFEQELVDRRQMIGLGVVLCGISVYLFSRFPNGWVRLIPPAAGPIVVAVFLTIRPWNPYGSLYASLAGISSETVKDDPAAQRLLTLLRSADARRVVWRTAVLTSLSLLSLVWLGATLTDAPSSWDVPYFGLAVFVVVQALLSGHLFLHCLLRWALQAWRSGE